MTIKAIQGWSMWLIVPPGSRLYLILHLEVVGMWTRPAFLIPKRNPPSSARLPGCVTPGKSVHLSEPPDAPFDNKLRLQGPMRKGAQKDEEGGGFSSICPSTENTWHDPELGPQFPHLPNEHYYDRSASLPAPPGDTQR